MRSPSFYPCILSHSLQFQALVFPLFMCEQQFQHGEPDSSGQCDARNDPALLVYVTLPVTEDAARFARLLVERNLAAGVNIISDVCSVYRWQDEIRSTREHVLLAQVSASGFENFRKVVLALHPYQVPCVVAMEIAAGHEPFLDWIRAGTVARSLLSGFSL